MGFREAKKLVLEAVREGRFRHEFRTGDSTKNILQMGLINVEEALAIIEQTRGHQATSSPHHFDNTITVWVFRPADWYIKFYLVDHCWFISFHKTEATL